jgi:DNA mismatch endonuclease (patch repair protein)
MVEQSGVPKRPPMRGKRLNRISRKLPRLDPLGEPGRQHRGDFVSPKTRSAVMARIRGRDTGPERIVGKMLMAMGLLPEPQVKGLPGRPDFILRNRRIAIFVDGDFWHGWRFPQWRLKLSENWEMKIEATRQRDARNHARLRRAGWKVLRIWEHQIAQDPDRVQARIVRLL